jgi:hypothetical protein
MPTYSLKNVESGFWVENNPIFGVWHDPDSYYHHKRACFEVDYHTNSFGMRDPERTLNSPAPRAIILGDSFVEGFGIPDGKRISDLLEKQTGMEYLNFGTGGYFGPTQYYLLYKNLAKKFSHNEVIVAIYPNNDFTDDDYTVWEKSGHYRPFWVGEYPNYRLVYSATHPRGEKTSYLDDLLREFSYSYNVFDYLHTLYKFKLSEYSHKKGGFHFAGYYDFPEAGWDRMHYSLEKIVEEAEGKKVIVILIPSPQDLERYGKEGTAPLSQKMEAWSQAHGVTLVDLLPPFSAHADWKQYFNFPCDRHLNEAGDALAAQIIQSKLYPTMLGGPIKQGAPIRQL